MLLEIDLQIMNPIFEMWLGYRDSNLEKNILAHWFISIE